MITTALLFIGFGVVAYATGESDTRKIGGLIGYYPKTAIIILIAGLSMAGVPPLAGFQSKLMLVQASLSCGFPELSLLAIIVSIATFVVFVIIISYYCKYCNICCICKSILQNILKSKAKGLRNC